MSDQVRRAKEAFGERLREIRKDASLSGRDLAAATGMHFTKVSRLEHGKQNPSETDIRSWCTACGAEDQTRELVATLRGIEGMWVEWQRHMKGGLKHLQQTFDRFHEGAEVVRSYESIVVPGILQTPEYGRAVLRIADDFYGAGGQVEEAVNVRMDRRKFLYQGQQRFLFVVEFWALGTRFGDKDVMRAQMERLLAVTTMPNVSFGVIPPDVVRRMWPGEGVWIFDSDVAVVETTTAEIQVTQPREVELFLRSFDRLREHAVYGDGARALIRRAIRELDGSG
ncbi:helix-turn-helix transcriptional regulator [Nocardiopsis dassonvillei]|uniref:helix-turn-helix domain-containing protein n=1 Tax=Nocardiopsis dassonvillei TaxID=2014 RepID=UPI00200F3FE3|nr:helix-turn-helix transcriptional regulator [Nocardiopsis dassonvillei]MCK9870037.1 helix-turn-helix transcriptional regulator [Nocardiopsis dassonvillei]